MQMRKTFDKILKAPQRKQQQQYKSTELRVQELSQRVVQASKEKIVINNFYFPNLIEYPCIAQGFFISMKIEVLT
jgi:hypothetical protein